MSSHPGTTGASTVDILPLIGWLSSAMLALCGLPMLLDVIRRGNTTGISGGFIILWTFGELLGTIYVWGNAPLMANYGANLLLTSTICYYYLKGRANAK